MTCYAREMQRASDDYEVKRCAISDLTDAEIEACIALVADGDAVGVAYVRRNLPRALGIAVARRNGQVVWVATIKPALPHHSATISAKSGVAFSLEAPELGYVAVHPDHRGWRLSPASSSLSSRISTNR